MSAFYITTPIYYVNDVPHLGHAYTTIAADTLARFHRGLGMGEREAAFLLTGTDEHGQKIEEAASAKGKTPQALADEVVERFRETWTHLNIDHDDFIRTTETRHKTVVADMWRRLENAGDIYLGSYDGWYCVSCEAFYPETQLEANHCCPIHKTAAKRLSEPSYFFRMSKYQDALLAHIERHPEFIRPDNCRNEIVSFVSSGLKDLSVSRTTFRWGISVPGSDDHVVYVWIDALTNYISALGGVDADGYKKLWPATCHLIGKDILRFHAVYWPCMLMSAGLPLPTTIFAHGWWTVRGKKISKTMPATRVDPNQLADDLGADALRYFVLREVPLGLDGDFSYEALIGRYNADLANDLGNLVSRALTLATKFADSTVPSDHSCDPALRTLAVDVANKARTHFEAYALSKALEEVWRLVRDTNRYIDATQPWALAKDPNQSEQLVTCVRTFLQALYWIARMIAPVMPTIARQLLTRLGCPDTLPLTWPSDDGFNDLRGGQAIDKGAPLFPRIDDDRRTKLLEAWIPKDVRVTDSDPPATQEKTATVTFDDFSRFDFRVGEVRSAEPIPKTSKLLRLTLDTGEEEPRQVVAGIAEAYEPEQLVGKRVIFLANLEPAKIRGVRSDGMILAAGDKHILGLSSLDREVPPGTKVR